MRRTAAKAPDGFGSGLAPKRSNRDASGPTRDTSGPVFTPFPTLDEHARLTRLVSLKPLVHARILNTQATRGSDAARAELRAAEDQPALLDSATPLVAPHAPHQNLYAPWALIEQLWPILKTYQGSTMELVSLSLTAPPGVDVREVAAAFSAAMLNEPPTGALMVVDRRGDGSEHFYCLALVHDAGACLAAWCQASGAKERCQVMTHVTGWNGFGVGQRDALLQNVAGVVAYAFKPWPVEHGYRRLREDVIASGAFAPAWVRALLAIEAESTAAARLEATRRECSKCGNEIPAKKRRHAKTCSAGCRQGAYLERRRTAASLPQPPTDTPGPVSY